MLKTPDLYRWPAGKDPAAEMCGDEARLGVLAQYGLDELTDDLELTEIVRFAAKLCDAPIAMVSLVHAETQVFLAREGIEERETPRAISFCSHAMLGHEPLEVLDALEDERFARNPLVTGHPHIRFYAGAPLISGEGAPLGSLCVIDQNPRTNGLTHIQREGLVVLAAAVMRRLRQRREAVNAAGEIERRENQLRTLIDSLPHVAFSLKPDGKFDYFNKRFDELTGAERPQTAEEFRRLIHQDDQEPLFPEWYAALERGEPFDRQFRLLVVDGSWRWVEVRVMPAQVGEHDQARWIGTITDHEESHRHIESREMLASELSHRIKNIFAVVTGLITLRARKWPEAEGFARELNDTIRTLGRAHDFVRPTEGAKGDSLAGLIGELMAPYIDETQDRIEVNGSDCTIGSRAATPLALIFHELATNSAKYGALSNDDGRIVIDMDCDDPLTVRWREYGAEVTDTIDEGNEGFGSRLVRMAVTGQLNGEMERTWHEDGLEIVIRIPIESVTS